MPRHYATKKCVCCVCCVCCSWFGFGSVVNMCARAKFRFERRSVKQKVIPFVFNGWFFVAITILTCRFSTSCLVVIFCGNDFVTDFGCWIEQVLKFACLHSLSVFVVGSFVGLVCI